MRARLVIFVVVLALSLSTMRGQAQVTGFLRSSAPVYGGTAGMPASPPNPFSVPIDRNVASAHKTPDGKVCMTVHARGAPQPTNPNIYNHLVLVGNNCGTPIKVQVCYYRSSSCIVVPLVGYQKIEKTLGISPGQTDFRYEYRELL